MIFFDFIYRKYNAQGCQRFVNFLFSPSEQNKNDLTHIFKNYFENIFTEFFIVC